MSIFSWLYWYLYGKYKAPIKKYNYKHQNQVFDIEKINK